MPVFFAPRLTPRERHQREHKRCDGVVREYLPWGDAISDHQPYLTSIAEELNDRPRKSLGFLTPREAFERLRVASTP